MREDVYDSSCVMWTSLETKELSLRAAGVADQSAFGSKNEKGHALAFQRKGDPFTPP